MRHAPGPHLILVRFPNHILETFMTLLIKLAGLLKMKDRIVDHLVNVNLIPHRIHHSETIPSPRLVAKTKKSFFWLVTEAVLPAEGLPFQSEAKFEPVAPLGPEDSEVAPVRLGRVEVRQERAAATASDWAFP